MVRGDELKHDGGKVRFELVDPGALELLAMVLTAGAAEYRDQGWWGLDTVEGRERIIGSLLRHLHAYRLEHADTIAIDDQFGLPHSGHLLACAMFLAAFDVRTMRADHEPFGWDTAQHFWKEKLQELASGREKEAR